MTYKVINPFDIAVKGDVFTNDEDPSVYRMSRFVRTSKGELTVEMTMDKADIDELIESGNLIEVKENIQCSDCDKLAKIAGKIDSMMKTYTKNYEDLLKQYEAGDVQPCVKVEAETVYYNVIKTLEILKKALDE